MSPSPPPIDAAEFDAHRNLSTIIVQFLCRNKDNGFSAKEIAQSLGIREEDVNYALLKLGVADLFSNLTGGMILGKHKAGKSQRALKIEDVTVNGVTYYRCLETD
jgi:hypothetical protein